MINLSISKCKPNPLGKDSFAGDIPNSQLAGEWADFYNFSQASLSLDKIELHHWAYTSAKPDGEWRLYSDFSGTLPPGGIVRVHSGGNVDLKFLKPIDVSGADYHVFSGKGYVLNNDKPDRLGLWDLEKRQWIDLAKYNAYPPEGKILVRSGEYLV